MREATAERYLTEAGAVPELLEGLIRSGRANRLAYRGHTYLVRRPVAEASER